MGDAGLSGEATRLDVRWPSGGLVPLDLDNTTFLDGSAVVASVAFSVATEGLAASGSFVACGALVSAGQLVAAGVRVAAGVL